MHDEHFDRLMSLIDIEREAERAENERKLEKMTVQAREALGKTVTRLVVTREDMGVGSHVLWILSRPAAGEEYSPFQALNQGDLVSITFQEQPDRRYRGTLYDVDQYEITVALDPRDAMGRAGEDDSPDFGPPKGRCQLDVLG